MRAAATRRVAIVLGALGLALALVAPAPAAVLPLGPIGAEGADGGALRRPSGIAIDAAGRVYVSDSFNARISVFRGDGRFAFAFGWDVIPDNGDAGFEVCAVACKTGLSGGGAGQLGVPTALAVDASGRLYVGELARVSVFQVGASGASFVHAFGWDVVPGNLEDRFEVCTTTTTCQVGAVGPAAGQLQGVAGLAVAPTGGELHVSDSTNQRIDVFRGDGTFVRAFGWNVNPDPSSGEAGVEVCTVTCQRGVGGGEAGQLSQPSGVALDGAGSLYVADLNNHRISIFDVGGADAGRFVRAFGWDVNPTGGAGEFEVCSTSCKPGIDGGGPGQLNAPHDVAVDAAGRIAISELAGHRITRFQTSGFVDAFGADVVDGGGFTFEVCSTAVTCKGGIESSALGGLRSPLAVEIDCRGALWVSDSGNSRVQRFGELGTAAPPCLPPPPAAPPPQPPPPRANLDMDGDGVQRPLDCNDADPSIKPGARDRPRDRIDQDCDGRDARFPLLRRTVDAVTATYPGGRYTIFRSMDVMPVRSGDRLRLSCRGRGCPLRAKTIRVRRSTRRLSLVRHLRRARLRAGAVVQLRITRPRTIGWVSTWTIRPSAEPLVKRSCLRPGAKKPSRCPR